MFWKRQRPGKRRRWRRGIREKGVHRRDPFKLIHVHGRGAGRYGYRREPDDDYRGFRHMHRQRRLDHPHPDRWRRGIGGDERW